METVQINLNGKDVTVNKDLSILEAAKANGIKIPSLCNHPDQAVKANCRVCVVEVEGFRNLVASCSTKVAEGMKIKTDSPRVRSAVTTIVELILADHPQECLTCIRNGSCELQEISQRLGISNVRGRKRHEKLPIDDSTNVIVRDPNKCIKCGRCVEACNNIQQVGILFSHYRSTDIQITPEYGRNLSEVSCVLCGQCILACPVGAIYEKDNTSDVWDVIGDPRKHVVVQVAPAVRVSIAEEFGMKPGSISTPKMFSALRMLGFDRVFDTNFSADLTIMEEGNELLHRIQNGGVLPMITSCSPGWIKYIEHYYPELLPHVSSCKSPQQMFGAVAKTYYAEKVGVPAEDIRVVSIMPCTAKKYEAARPEMNDSGFQDVDIVLTTREFGRMIKQAGIEFDELPDGEPDSPLGKSTGAAALFGATGGVMEAALRTVYEVVTGETLEKMEFEDVRGYEGIKSASVDLAGQNVNVAVSHGLSNAKEMMEMIKSGEGDYTFIEVMCCPGGCIGGGGQPYGTTTDTRKKRIESIYEVDRNMPIRKSHENPEITEIYKEFIIEPLGEKSHKLLHTKYTDRKKSAAK